MKKKKKHIVTSRIDYFVPPPKVSGDILLLVRTPLVSASALALASASARQILVSMIFLEPFKGIPPNLSGHGIGTSLRVA